MSQTTETNHTGNGSKSEYNFTFPYMKEEDVKVDIDNVLQNANTYTFHNATTLKFTADNIPANNAVIRIYRSTDDSGLTSTFYPGSAIRSGDLNDNFTQNLYSTQENTNSSVTALNNSRILVDGAYKSAITRATEAEAKADIADGIADAADTKATTAIADSAAAVLTANAALPLAGGTMTGNIVLQAGDITAADIGDNQVNSQHYAAGSIDLEHMSAESVDSDQYVDGSIDNIHIAAGTITSDKLNAATVVIDSEQAAATANDTSFFTTSASDSRYFKQDTGGTGETYDSSATWSGNDTHIATTKAIDNRVVDLIDEVGGFIALDSEAALPQYHPEKENVTTADRVGTILSIGALTATYTPSGGTCTIPANTLTNHAGAVTATITDCGSQELTSGFGLLIETTAQTDAQYANGPQYKFHRLVPKAAQVDTVATNISHITAVSNKLTEVETVSDDIANVNTVAGSIANVNLTGGSIANVNTVGTNIATVNHYANEYQYAASTNSPTTDPAARRTGGNLAEGDVWFDTTANLLKVYNGSAWETAVASPNALILKSTVDAKGDLLTASANDTVIRTPVGTNHKMLKADSGANGGVSWDLIDSENIENGAIDIGHMSDNSVDSDQYVDASIDGIHIADDQIDSQHYVAGSIDNEHLAANSVDSDQYVDGSIDLAHMSDNSVDSDQYVDGSIDRVHLAADIIDGTKIDDDVIDSEHYVAGSIDLEHMSANSVDSDQYVDGSIDLAHMSVNSVDSDQYVDGSIDGVHIANDQIDSQHYAAGSIDNEHMAANSVDSDQYVDGSIDVEHLADDAVDADSLYVTNTPANNDVLKYDSTVGGKLKWEALAQASVADGAITNIKMADNAIDSAEIVAGAVDLSHMNDNSVDSRCYVDGSIDNEHLAANAVDSDNIAAGAIDNIHMAANSVDSGAYVDGSIDTVHLSNDAVDGTKLADAISNTSLTINGAVVGLGPNMADSNTVLGKEAAQLLESTGVRNVAIGEEALHGATGGGNNDDNVAIGYQAGKLKDDAERNISIGSYAGGSQYDSSSDDNIAIGYEALHEATYGSDNIAIGSYALWDQNSGSQNIAIGHEALKNAGAASESVAIGYQSMYTAEQITNDSSEPVDNTCVGWKSGYALTKNRDNTFIGHGTGMFVASPVNTPVDDASYNVAVGSGAMTYCSTVQKTVAIGYEALKGSNGNTTGDDNVAIGYLSLYANTTGNKNVAVGKNTCTDNTTGHSNTAVGTTALHRNVSGDYNTAVGLGAMNGGSDGYSQNYSTAIGYQSMYYCGSGANYNTAVGYRSLYTVTTGQQNTAIGKAAGYYVSSGSGNSYLGDYAGCNYPNVPSTGYNPYNNSHKTGSNCTYLGAWSRPTSTSTSNEVVLGNDDITNLVCAESDISSHSDGRDKTDIVELPIGLDFINTIKPVKFTWAKRDNPDAVRNGTIAAGFIAQDFQSSMTAFDADFLDLVYDENPDRLQAKYGKLLPVLVQAVKELSTQVNQLKEELKLCTRT